jgi:hypothetical protein
MKQDYDVLIVGGGLAGNCLALALQDSDLKIAIVEYLLRYCIMASISAIVFGIAWLKTWYPCLVTSTSSSMRMPMPRHFSSTVAQSSGMYSRIGIAGQ